MYKILILLAACFMIHSCVQSQNTATESVSTPSPENTEINSSVIDTSGYSIKTRFNPPEGFERIPVQPNTFAAYLRELPLKSSGSKVKHFDGSIKGNYGVYEAVVDMDIDKRDLQQCADAVIRLRAEYLYSQKKYDLINFQFTNGFEADFGKWRKGNRIAINGNNVSWKASSSSNSSYKSFRRYLIMVFAYAGTYSVARETKAVDLKDISIGDIFIKGGSPGHAVIVVDMAINQQTGKKIFLLAQSYMPAQDIQILQNPENGKGNPWYNSDFTTLYTPEWTFDAGQLRRYE